MLLLGPIRGGYQCLPDPLAAIWRQAGATVGSILAGTGLYRFCMPLDGCGGLGRLAGMDEPSFCRPPDLVLGCWLSLVELEGWLPLTVMNDVLVGTDKR